MRHILIAITLTLGLFNAAASAQEWSEWQEIAATDSGITIAEFDNLPEIARLESTMTDADRELWEWDSGRLFMIELHKNYFHRRGKGDFVEAMSKWQAMADMGVMVSKKDIKRAVNKMGKYYYAAVPAPDSDMVCFIFMQDLSYTVPAGYEAGGGLNSGGFVDGFDCQDGTQISVTEHEETMKQIVATFRRQ